MNTPSRRITRTAQQVLSVLLLCIAFGGVGAKSQERPQNDQQFLNQIRSVEGPDLFQAYCAPCHGTDGKGRGPAASALKSRVPDLTVLRKANGGVFPSVRVRKLIDGDEAMVSHGSREMPIWGPIFHHVRVDMDWGDVRAENVVKYLESIQSELPSTPRSGADLYKQFCASCHGADLKGSVPAPPPPPPYKKPPDLTTLAKRHKGKFPDGYVTNILKNGVVMPAHGPAQMPIWGTDFKSTEVENLKNYIKSFQVK